MVHMRKKLYTFSGTCSGLGLLFAWLLCGCSVPETDFIQPVPIALDATAVMSTSFVASWKPVLGSSTYLVDVSTDAQFSSYVEAYQSREVNDTHLQITGLAVEKQYYYRVRAQKGNTISGNSNTITVTTAALDAPVATPATNIKVFQFTAHWETVSDAASYRVEVATDSNFTALVSGYDGIEVISDSLKVDGLDYRQTYYYRITAKRLEKTSGYSNVIKVKPCISPGCKLSKITTGFGESVTFLYDDAGKITSIVDSYETMLVHYTDAGMIGHVDITRDGSLLERDSMIFSNGLMQSTLIDSNGDGQMDGVKDYIYNNQQVLIGFRQYSDPDRVNLSIYQDYQLDANGNPVKILDAQGNEVAQFRYDDKFNPKMLIPQPLRQFILDDFDGYYFQPYLWLNNPVYARGTFYPDFPEEEVFIYDVNSCDVALARKGYYKLNYEFTGCDF